MIMLRSLPLNWTTWGLVLDAAGNWNLFTEAQANSSVAQDAACAIRTFLGECWYNVLLGLPYYQNIFGQNPPVSFLTAKITAQALTMPTIDAITVIALGLRDVPMGGSTLQQLTGSFLVYPVGSADPIPVTL